MAAPTAAVGSIAENLVSRKVSISKPPYVHDVGSYRYASDLSLNNVQIRPPDWKASDYGKRARAQSATIRKISSPSKPRRVSSAKERLTNFRDNHTDLGKITDKPVGRRPVSAGLVKHRNDKSETIKRRLERTPSLKPAKKCSVPQALESLSSSISMELPEYLNHPALRGSIILLPSSSGSSLLPTLPPAHYSEDEYPYTHEVPLEHIHRPKKYSHPYYERVKKIKGWTCNHSGREIRVTSHTGQTIHRFTLEKHRNKSDVRDEIVELERLMKGLSTEWGKSTVSLYQNEINNLQKMVKETLLMTSLPETPPETPDPTGLRKFCREYDTALQALEARHQQCMKELKELEEIEELYIRAKQLEGLE